jgi:SAM-dependent methyltransferase
MIFSYRFGEESIEKIVEWTQDHLPRESVSPVSILEIGSGNGTLLFGLAEEFGSRATIHGIDYSPDAIKLAVAIGKERGGPAGDVRFDVCDFLNEDVTGSSDSWDIILDKGTLDAIALGDKDQLGRSPAHAYPTRLRRLLKPGSIFLVTCKRLS